MASKGPRSKLDHETRARRQKALEASREPRRPKTHWDHVLEEMVWLSKDFESERKWKLAQAKKVAIRASKGMLDPATREEKKIKEEEQRLRKVALNISKDVKKFWMKIEKLVLYKHQLELDEKKKKALDKQLEFLLGQTERYSTMLAENLIDAHRPLEQNNTEEHRQTMSHEEDEENFRMEVDAESHPETADIDEDFNIRTDDESEDNEQTIEEDEALITEEERKEELEALRNEIDLPLEELLKQYASEKGGLQNGNGPSSPEGSEDAAEQTSDEKDQDNCMRNDLCTSGVACEDSSVLVTGRRCVESNGSLSVSDNHVSEMETSEALASVKDLKTDKDRVHYDFHEEQEDVDYVLAYGEDKDDEATLSEEEELAKADSYNPMDEIAFLQRESEIPIEQVVARYKKDTENGGISEDDSGYASALSEDAEDSAGPEDGGLGKESISESDVEPYGHLLVSSSAGKEVQTGEQNDSDGRDADNRIADAAAAARSAQPTGNTFSTTKVRTKFPFLLKHPLREYQHIGLDWLVTMYEKRLNGILADEMGLGKTIMTIAVLAHLACEKGIWGPHLIVVPTSVMLNWETEFLKWCPAFKILTYFGSAKERKFKRQGWLKPNSFHVCITTYRLVIQDSKVFKRKKWKYLILDEAHLIKNWKSQRWQTLLNFHSKRRILLTGTPLQNDLMELWSLMHFLMPHIFQSHQEFKDWFCNPISGMVEGQEKVNKEVVDRLHNVLRPFILRRLKRDVEKQLPMKHEHVIYCRLSRRQRNLYEDFIASSETQATLASANFFGMISIIMQLRKVCNHPDLFEGRPIISSFDMEGIVTQLSSSVCSILSHGPFSAVDFDMLGLLFTNLDFCMTSWESDEVMSLETPTSLIIDRVDCNHQREIWLGIGDGKRSQGPNIFVEIRKALWKERLREAKERATSIAWWNSLRCRKKPMYSTSLREIVTIKHPVYDIHRQKADRSSYLYSSKLADIVLSPIERFERMTDLVESFMFAIPAARAPEPICWCRRRDTSVFLHPSYGEKCSQILLPLLSPIRPAIVRRQVYFPDRRLIQFDCGKLQQLASLLRKLKSEGHRALIFTQMTKMLDILEAFINLYGYTYMRLDGSTQPEERQTLMQRFNTNPKIFLFILSTRSGGVGINLVGADTVIFYDSDWNPAMDQQAQDRCHRIGQTREVHIYRLISESTIEENILKKANQKRALDDLVIQSGGYNTEFFKKLDPMELFSGHKTLTLKNMHKDKNHNNGSEVSLSNADVEAALKSAEDEADYMALKKVELEEAVDNQEFSEEAIGKMEDDEFINEDELKDDEPADQGGQTTTLNTENGTLINSSDFNEDGALAISGKEDDLDMLADVKQMAAAAAAAGQAVSSFESQLRPIDRYAMRFLELWDPIIDKTAVESQVGFEETEWELDRLEKYKEEMEADIDDDEEPLVYERWDADFATEAYRQHVEALAQHQLMEELELEAKEKEYMDNENYDDNSELPRASKPKSKKKAKKAKFKSLKKGSLSSDAKRSECGSPVELMYSDDDIICDDVSDAVLSRSAIQKKRKKDESIEDTDEEKPTKKKSKKHGPPIGNCLDLDVKLSDKKDEDCTDSKLQGHMAVDREQKIASRIRMGGKVSITMLSTKRLFMIKPEKLKKGSIWSRDCVPSPDLWLPQEDAVLCAVVHEYGTNWTLISDALYGMTAGGLYRGRYRHPVHCCERFRELIQRYVLSGAENPNSDKVGQVVSGKALLKVTEDNIRMLLDFAMDLPDNELLLQKHFTALLSSVWRVTSHDDSRRNLLSSRNGLYLSRRILGPGISHASRNSVHAVVGKVEMTNLNHSRKSIAAALHDATDQQNETVCTPAKDDEPPAIEQGLEVTLQFQQEEDDLTIPLPSFLKLSIQDAIPLSSANSSTGEKYLKSSGNIMESRYRDASRACLEDSVGCSTSTFSTSDSRTRSSQKPPALGKHKLPVMDSIRPSKSKSRKTNTEFGSNNRPISEPLSQPLQKVSVGYPDVQFNFTSPMFNEIGTDDFQTGFCSTIGDVSSLESQDVIPLAYDPGLISDLDDCSLLPEYTDIG